jgi:manganese/zinc/iron transport system permease protein
MTNIIVTYYVLIIVSLGAMLVGATAAAVGVFALLRRQSLLGDAISHAALPGIALMFLMGYGAQPWLLMIGGGIAGSIGAFLVTIIVHTTTLKRDALLGIMLSVFFGFGLVLKTVIQKQGFAHQAALGKFFFGNASTLLPADIMVIMSVSLLVGVLLYMFWKEFVALAFDSEYMRTAGYPIILLDSILTLSTIFAIVIGLHTVGVLLMSALLIAPAAAARQWSSSVKGMLGLALLFGAFSGLCGAITSSFVQHLPTGPMIVVCLSIILIFSFIFSPIRQVGRSES